MVDHVCRQVRVRLAVVNTDVDLPRARVVPCTGVSGARARVSNVAELDVLVVGLPGREAARLSVEPVSL